MNGWVITLGLYAFSAFIMSSAEVAHHGGNQDTQNLYAVGLLCAMFAGMLWSKKK